MISRFRDFAIWGVAADAAEGEEVFAASGDAAEMGLSWSSCLVIVRSMNRSRYGLVQVLNEISRKRAEVQRCLGSDGGGISRLRDCSIARFRDCVIA